MKVGNQKKSIKGNGGAALIMVILFLLFIGTVVVSGTVNSLVRDYKKANNAIYSIKAYNLAEAGVEDMYYRIQNEMNYSSSEELVLDGATTTTEIVTSGNDSIITSVSHSNDRYRKVEVGVSTTIENVNILYGALAGQGGIWMANGSFVTGTGGVEGDVYSNGPILGDHLTTIHGNALAGSGITEQEGSRSMICNTYVEVGKVEPMVDYAQSFLSMEDAMLTKASIYIKKIT